MTPTTKNTATEPIEINLEQLTPENRVKFWNKYFELLAEQRREQTGEASDHA